MSHAVRRLFACLLLVLLPFQAFAAGNSVAKAPLVACAAMMADMDCCGDDGSCTPIDCLAVNAAALPASAPAALAPGFRDAPAAVLATLHESFVPDGLQRPPQAHA